MEQDLQRAESATQQVKKRFDETIIRHVEHSMAGSHAAVGLPMDVTTISCLVILAERESEIEAYSSDLSEHFSRDSFLEELEQLGLDAGQEVREKVNHMVDKGFIDIKSDGKLIAGKPTMEVAQSLDKAFPGMPGMNLVAYLVQTLDEAVSGRKDPEAAVLQLDQTLKMHSGVAHQQQAPTSSSTAKQSGRQSDDMLKSALSATLKKRKAAARASSNSAIADQPKVVTASGAVKTLEIKEVFPKKHRPSDGSPDLLKDKESEGLGTPEEALVAMDTDGALLGPDPTVASDEDMGGEAETTPRQTPVPSQDDLAQQKDGSTAAGVSQQEDEPAPALSPQEPEQSDLSVPPPSEEQVQKASNEQGPRPDKVSLKTTLDIQEDSALSSDEALEERISAFEQNLAMTCPVCKTGRIETKQTAKGKTFYVCNNSDCVFVSWGKPYHLACPWCNNPFLIEATGKTGKPILKCPRATCRYQQGLPGQEGSHSAYEAPTAQVALPTQRKVRRPRKKKRVVRRRVVRKKR